MLAWIELIFGLVVALIGLALMCSAAVGEHEVPTVEDERWAVAGVIALVIGALSFIIGFIQLSVQLVQWVIS